jgi:hypothetical protein
MEELRSYICCSEAEIKYGAEMALVYIKDVLASCLPSACVFTGFYPDIKYHTYVEDLSKAV